MSELLAFLLGAGIAALAMLPYLIKGRASVLELEAQLKRRRHTYATADGLEDALAVVIELLLRREAEEAYTQARLGQLQEILGMIRAGPLEYDAERPNGRARTRSKQRSESIGS